MTRFTPSPNGSHLRGKKNERGALHLCDREGSGRVTSFLTSSTVTPPLTALALGDVGRLSEASLEAFGDSE
jgi:hypothetical protein